MHPRGVVAVSEDLAPVAELLARRGYTVLPLGQVDWRREGERLTAVVLSGRAENVLGIHDTLTPAPVIRAAGLTPEQVAEEVERRGLPGSRPDAGATPPNAAATR